MRQLEDRGEIQLLRNPEREIRVSCFEVYCTLLVRLEKVESPRPLSEKK